MNPSIVPASIRQTAKLIFLHGLGDSGTSWLEILPPLVPAYTKIILPNAPLRQVTLNQGIRMPAWFDLRPLDQPKDEIGIKQASNDIQNLIEEETKDGTPANRIVLGGFSQGGALALYSGLTGKHKLGGILALSTWLPLDKSINWESTNKNVSILQCHGIEDEMVDIKRAEKAAQILGVNTLNYKFKEYEHLNHSIGSDQEMKDIRNFLDQVIPSTTAQEKSERSKL